MSRDVDIFWNTVLHLSMLAMLTIMESSCTNIHVLRQDIPQIKLTIAIPFSTTQYWQPFIIINNYQTILKRGWTMVTLCQTKEAKNHLCILIGKQVIYMLVFQCPGYQSVANQRRVIRVGLTMIHCHNWIAIFPRGNNRSHRAWVAVT